jgi:hypothetical protein
VHGHLAEFGVAARVAEMGIDGVAVTVTPHVHSTGAAQADVGQGFELMPARRIVRVDKSRYRYHVVATADGRTVWIEA